MDIHSEKVTHAKYHIVYNSNPHIKSFLNEPVYTTVSDECDIKLMGEIELKAGLEGEIAIRNIGYIDEDDIELGVKAYIGVDPGANSTRPIRSLQPIIYRYPPISTPSRWKTMTSVSDYMLR